MQKSLLLLLIFSATANCWFAEGDDRNEEKPKGKLNEKQHVRWIKSSIGCPPQKNIILTHKNALVEKWTLYLNTSQVHHITNND